MINYFWFRQPSFDLSRLQTRPDTQSPPAIALFFVLPKILKFTSKSCSPFSFEHV